MLQNQPHALHIIFGIPPVAARIQITQIQFVLETLYDTGGRQRNLTRHESLATAFALVIEQDSVHGKHAVALTIVFRYPETVLLGHAVGRTRIERRGLPLRHFLHLAEQFGRGSLINAASLLQPADTHGLQEAERAHGISLGRVFRHVERHFHVALCSQVIDFRGMDVADNPNQRTAVRHVAPMQVHQTALLHVAHPFVQIQMFDTCGVKGRRTAHDAMHFISLFNQKLGQIGAVLPRDTGNQCYFSHNNSNNVIVFSVNVAKL